MLVLVLVQLLMVVRGHVIDGRRPAISAAGGY